MSVPNVAAAVVAAAVAAGKSSSQTASMRHLQYYPHLQQFTYYQQHSHHPQQNQQNMPLVCGSGSVFSGVVSTEMMVMVDGVRHCLIQEGSKRWRCKRCHLRGHEKRTRLRCHQCCVALCSPCFRQYHSESEEQRGSLLPPKCTSTALSFEGQKYKNAGGVQIYQ